MQVRRTLVFENLTKNLLSLFVLAASFSPLEKLISSAGKENSDTLLLFSSLTLVAVLFGNFAFTYSFSNVRNFWERFLSHATTFLLMVSIGVLLEVSAFALALKIPSLGNFALSVSALVYLTAVLYDFWDSLRATV